MDLARARHAKLIATVDTDKVDYRDVELTVEVAFGQDASKKKPVPGAFKKFTETQWNSVKDLVQFYEETMYPIRAMHRVYKSHELTSFHIKDVLKRGLSAFKQDYLDEQKAEQTKVKALMKECDDFIQAAVKDAFTTALCNDLANILRIAGEKNEAAHGMCLKVLEDMNMMRVAYDDVTREILRVAVFNDGPYDNSALLFEVIEAPERGEVSLNQGSLEQISDEALKLISNRHQTPLDDGLLLRSNETHPNLQRSPE
ncbi:hypothetical protein STCU_06591 [Strigomonas culicis]|nr:hypothetical protein STCU_06591 [Strigomonas culicis]|eukprot:EPY25652.1 hypothetical protein STCU_06591 [Strigomonas culicis]